MLKVPVLVIKNLLG